MKVLVACEFSGVVRDAFRVRGHQAWSCDLLPTEREGPHLKCDVREVLDGSWDLLVAHPPCTYLSRAGARWWKDPERKAKADAAAEFVFLLRDAAIAKIAIENPVGQLNRRWRYPDQIIEPHEFGDRYTKRTCLWLKNLPPLFPTAKIIYGAPSWLPSNTGWNRQKGGKSQPGVVHTAKAASRTFPGIAAAMAEQWGDL